MAHINSKLSSISTHTIAVLSALVWSVKYSRQLNIKAHELKRYLKKSTGLALCYSGFAEVGKIREAWLAGEAAFFCCAYDVVTDWRGFSEKERIKFEEILKKSKMPLELQKLTIGLYEKELFNKLEDDGLDRGAIALRFILKMMKCEKSREIVWQDLDEIGYLLQIVDDVLDYEDDLIYGDMNCLTSERRDIYLVRLIQKFGNVEVRRLFGNENSILIKVIEKARNKAKELLKKEVTNQENTRLVAFNS